MQEKNARERVLKKIRKALIQKEQEPGFPQVDLDSEIYERVDDDLSVVFAQEFVKNDGRFIYCHDQTDFLRQFFTIIEHNQWHNIICYEEEIDSLFHERELSFLQEKMDFENVQAGITSCDALVARIGGILLSSRKNKSRMISIFPPVHIVVAYSYQLVFDLKDGFDMMKHRYNDDFPSMTTVVTGPSRTADIEKTLVLGAHGPSEIYLFLIDEE